MSATNRNGNGRTNGHASGRIVCPVSLEHQDPLAAGYKLHYTTAAEVREFGCCRKCWAKFKARHFAVTHEGRTETPVTFEVLHQVRDEATEHFGFVAPGEFVQTVDFDYAAVDGHEGAPDSSDDKLPLLADVLRAILTWCWNDWRLNRRPESAFRKFVAMSATINPSLLDDLTFKQLGESFGGVTRAAFSKASLQFQDQFGIKARRSFSKAAREGCRKARFKQIEQQSGQAHKDSFNANVP